ncbi:MAG: hypothetical protein WCP58_05025 [bacterium]
MLGEYRWALPLKFCLQASAGPEVSTSLLRTEYAADVCAERKAEAAWSIPSRPVFC